MRFGTSIRAAEAVQVALIDITNIMVEHTMPFISGIYGTIIGLDNILLPTMITLDFVSSPGKTESDLSNIYPVPVVLPGGDERRQYTSLYQSYSSPALPVLDSRQGTLLSRTKAVIPASMPGALTVNSQGAISAGAVLPREVRKPFSVNIRKAWNEGPGYGKQALDRIYCVLHVHSLGTSLRRDIQIDYRIGYRAY